MFALSADSPRVRLEPWRAGLPANQEVREASWATNRDQPPGSLFVETGTVETKINSKRAYSSASRSGSSSSGSSTELGPGKITLIQGVWAQGQQCVQVFIVKTPLGTYFCASSDGSVKSTSGSDGSHTNSVAWTHALACSNLQCPSFLEPKASEVANPGAELLDPSSASCNTRHATTATSSSPTSIGSISCPQSCGTLPATTSYLVDKDMPSSPSLKLPIGTLSL